MTALILVALTVMSVSVLASLAEASLFSVPYSKVLALVNARKPGAKALRALKDDMSRTISTIVIVDNIADLIGSAFVGALAAERFSSFGLGVFFAAFTMIAIVFAKVLPKTLGEAHAAALAPWIAPFILIIVRVFRPVSWCVDRIVAPFHGERAGHSVSEEEIKVMAALGRQSGSIERDESRLIHRVFKLNDITADDMMTPAERVESIPGDVAIGEQRQRVLDLRHSRVPVTGDGPEQILGVALSRDLIAAAARDEFQATPTDFLQEALRVRNDAPADDLIPLFQQKGQHLAIVEDHDSRMLGIVTLEDVLEELVGEIADEKDVRPETIKRVSKTEILVDEGTDVARVNHFFNVAIAAEGTVGDHVLEKFGRKPKQGESVEDHGLTFTVAKTTRTRPKHIVIRKPS